MNLSTASSPFAQIPLYLTPRRRTQIFYAVVLALVALGIFQSVKQYRETKYVNEVARNIATQAGSKDTLATVVALRDYLRQNVKREYFSPRGRPFLRNTAAETLASGKGRCGESTRAFINMAAGLGIRARRLYLYGRRLHVVALVTLDNQQQVIVDPSDRFYFREIEPLANVTRHAEFDSYSSFNRRRTIFGFGSSTLDVGPLYYFIENPHALLALIFMGLAFGFTALRLLHPVRSWRKRRAMVELAANEWQTASASSASA
jgi:hypothetical protein